MNKILGSVGYLVRALPSDGNACNFGIGLYIIYIFSVLPQFQFKTFRKIAMPVKDSRLSLNLNVDLFTLLFIYGLDHLPFIPYSSICPISRRMRFIRTDHSTLFFFIALNLVHGIYILDGNLEHAADALKKIDLFWEKSDF